MYKNILLADDHSVVRVGTGMILKEKYNDIVITHAENYDEVKEHLRNQTFDLLVLDISMPGSLYKNMIKDIKSVQPQIKILIFSSTDESIAVQYIKEGAEGYLNKISDEYLIIKAVESIFEKGFYYSDVLVKQVLNNQIQKPITEVLSEREFQVFKLLAEGNGNLEISNILNIGEPTVGTYKRRIYEKLEIDNIISLYKLYVHNSFD